MIDGAAYGSGARSAEPSVRSGFSQDDLDSAVSERLKEMQDIIKMSIDERIQELLPLYELDKSKGSVTAKSLIQKAKSDDDYIMGAALMYSSVEEELIYNFGLEHRDKRFVIGYSEYMQIADSAKIGDRFLLKRYNHDTGEYDVYPPNVLESGDGGEPVFVEMPPIVRFIKAGLNASEAKRAAEYWTVLNKIRHRSPDNEAYLNRLFEEIGTSKREYLMQALEFFKDCGLYTKE